MKAILAIRSYARFTMAIGLVLLALGGAVAILTVLLELVFTGDVDWYG